MTKTSSIDRIIGSRLRARRIANGMDKQTLAQQIGGTETQIHAFEAGHQRIDARSMLALCRALDLDVSDLFETWVGKKEGRPTDVQLAAE